jgi:hypothetical protein
MKTKKIIFPVAALLILIAGCSAGQPAATVVQTDKSEVKASATVVEPTAIPSEIPTEEPTLAPTEEPTAEPTEEPTAVPTEADTPTPEATINKRFVPAYEGNLFYLDSDIAEADWKKSMENLARNQAIPKPFEWQFVGVPDETKWSDIFPYFKEYLVDKGWTVTADGGDWKTIAGGNTMYVGGFINTVDGKKQKISLLFYPATKDSKSDYIVFYSERK